MLASSLIFLAGQIALGVVLELLAPFSDCEGSVLPPWDLLSSAVWGLPNPGESFPSWGEPIGCTFQSDANSARKWMLRRASRDASIMGFN